MSIFVLPDHPSVQLNYVRNTLMGAAVASVLTTMVALSLKVHSTATPLMALAFVVTAAVFSKVVHVIGREAYRELTLEDKKNYEVEPIIEVGKGVMAGFILAVQICHFAEPYFKKFQFTEEGINTFYNLVGVQIFIYTTAAFIVAASQNRDPIIREGQSHYFSQERQKLS